MGQLKQSSTAGGGLVWTQTNLPLTPQETTLLYKGMEVVDNTNNQTVGGNKTFTGTVKINNAPVATTDGVNKAYVDGLSAQAVKSVTGTDPIVATAGKTPVISIKDATPTQKGSMSAADKAKLDGHPTLVVNKAGDTMTGSLTTTAGLYADGEIRSKNQVTSTDSTGVYSTRMVVAGTVGYFQAGKVDRDVADQKLILSGWQGTPLTMSRFAMVNGVNPQVLWGSTTYDILHRGNMPTVTDLNAVSKSGDTIAHLTINPNGYFKQNYHADAGYKFSKLIGTITDSKAGLIVLGEIKTTNQNPEGFAGTISIQRGSSGSYNITNVINLVVKRAYDSVTARIISTTPPVSGGRLCKITHESKEYIAYYSPSTASRNVVVDCISWGIEPFVIPDATGYVLSDLVSSTDTIRTDINDFMLNNNNNERVPSWGVSAGQGFVMHGKTAIGGANDGWLRLNPFDSFATGIYTGNGIIRHGGTSIQLGSLGDAQATTLYRPNDVAWGLTTGGYAAVSVKQNTSSAAHWLLGSYKGSVDGDMRAGIQVLSNDAANMRLYTNMRTHYAEIRDGNVLVSGVQSAAGSSLTRKDYVDGQDALKVNKAGDTMTGNLTVNANINASNIFSTGSITANTTSTSSGLRLSSNASGYSEIVPRRANEADFIWTGGIRYYDSNNYWTIGTNRILHDAYSPRLTSIENSLDLNTISVPVKTMSLAHFGSAATNKPNTSNSANSVVHISTWETGTYAHQLAFSSDGKIYNRYNNNISWSDWGQVYTSIYKPTPAEVGAVNKTGDTMTGVLNVPRLEISGSAAGISYGSNKNIIRSGTGTAIVIGNFTDTTYIDSLNGDVKVRPVGSTEYKIYHEGNKPTADEVGAPIKMQFAGDLNTIRTAGHYRLNTGFTNGPSGSYQYAQMLHVNGGGDTHMQIMGAYSSQHLFWRGFNNSFGQGGNWNRIYHEGSKPTLVELGAAPSGYGLGETTTVMGSRSQFMAYASTPETGEVPYNGAGWQAAYGPNRRAQIYIGSNGRLLSRFSLSSTEKDNTTPWATHYTTLNKPTADDVGATPSGYGIGEVAVLKSDANALPNVGGIFAASGAGSLNYASQYSPIIQAFRPGGADATGQVLQIQESTGSIAVRSRNEGNWSSWNKLYGERNRPTPGDVGAVNKTGDTMTGDLAAPTFKSTGNYAFVRTVDNEHGIFLSNTTDKRTIIGAATGGGVIELRPFGIGTTTARTTFNTDGTITSTGTPTVSGHLSTKGYVDSAIATGDALQVSKSGDTMTGNLTVPAVLVSSEQHTNANSLTRKDYVDTEVRGKLGNNGDQILTGNFTVSTNAPTITLHETDTTKRFLLVVDGASARFQADNTNGTVAWSVNPDGIVTLNSPNTSTSQGTNSGSLTRKDYVDGQVATRAPSSHNHTAAQANSNVVAGEYYAVGSYVLAQKTSGVAIGYGVNVAGATLIPASAGSRYWDGVTCPGTWKCLGYAENTSAEVDQRTTLFIRIS